MAIALGTPAAPPLYLYIVFLACVIGALALLITGWVSHRRSSWPKYWQSQSTHRTDTKAEGYPAEPATPATVAVRDATASVPAKKTTATRTATKKTTAAKKTTAKK